MMKLIMLLLSLIILNLNKIISKYMYIIILILTLFLMPNLNNLKYMNNIYLSFMFDNISFILIILTFWIISLSILSNMNFKKTKFYNLYMFIMLMMLIFLFLCFSSNNLFLFYLMFESSLIPLIMLIMSWGYQINRIQASMYMILYTIFGSLPFLILVFFEFIYSKTLMMMMLMFLKMNMFSFLFFFMLMFMFLVKLPMYFIHLWLPKAHVEAPVSGSMILASIMLKLGVYGIMRLMFIYYNLMLKFKFILINLMIFASILACMNCLSQLDMKIIIAYSSIVHMNMMMSSLLMFKKWSYQASLILMISHGLCSSAMFCLTNFFYERSNSRSLLINKGLINLYPTMSMWSFLIFSNNFSSPPSLNLIGELFISFIIINYSYFFIMFILLILILSTLYMIFLYTSINHNQYNFILYFNNMNTREFILMMLHWIPLNFMFLNLSLL
uniref:NADH-ubiquinone oxidoreductase chain 4 n=1 Tax=Pselaphanus sp. QL-2013 TaxID=1421598 RepID=A0A0A6ZLY6_9HYME|nr:NADH dehydrogenase subunit 4 [Pselaphanus sp. QL-2013]